MCIRDRKLATLLYARPLAKQDIAPTIEIALLMCAVVALMTASVLWMILRGDARAKNNLLPQS